MSAISFVVRDVAGNISRGSVAGEGAPSSLFVGAGADVSLNLTRGQIISYTRQGQALEITLIDGRVIVIEGFFTMEGVSENQLFLSADGYLTEVQLTAGAGADYYATYAAGDGLGKFAANDDLYFMRGADVMLAESYAPGDDEVGMLAGALGGIAPIFGLGGAAAAGAAVIATAGGGGPDAPEISVLSGTAESGGDVVNQDGHAEGVTITGGGTAGGSVEVVIDGEVQTTTVGEDGSWSVTFGPDQINEGEYETDVQVTIANEGGSSTATGTLVVDTVIGVDMEATGGADGVINAVESEGGITLTGTVTGGDSVSVTIDGEEYAAVIVNGVWSVGLPSSVIYDGEYEFDVVVNTWDAAGNSSSVTSTVVVDTITSVTIDTTAVGGADNVVNGVEQSSGVTINGTAQAGASVVVTFAGSSMTVIAGQDGSWSASYPASSVPSGELTADVIAVATDAAGNTATSTSTVAIDTFVNELEITSDPIGGDGVVNFDESGQSITMAGTVEVGSTVSVNLHGVVMAATVDANGNWSVTYPAGTLPGGEYETSVTVTATDAAGNSSSLSEAVTVDTVAGDLALSELPIEIDDVVNAVEASDGVIINGTATPGLLVTVNLGDAQMQVMAGPNGTWSANFPAGQIPGGTYDALITASITDAAGNYKEVSDTVHIDTVVDNYAFSSNAVEGDDVINGAEAVDGVVLSGSVEPFSQVVVEFGGQSITVNAGSTGVWSANFPASAVAEGEYMATMTATATDPAGNVEVITDQVEVDTYVNTLTSTDPVGGDSVVSADEAANGITLGGSVEAGSTVMVTFEGVTRAATVDAAGNWSVTFSAEEVPAGEYDATVTIAATDPHGNTDSITDTFHVDTVAPDAPGVESVTITDDGVEYMGIETTGNDVTVNEVTSTGSVNELADQDDGIALPWGETLFNFDPALSDGSHLVVNETDDAGNDTATYVVLEETRSNEVDLVGLDGFDIGAIDLSFAKDSELTLDLSTLEGLSDDNNNLVIHGGFDDTVNLDGAVSSGQQTTIGGKSYDIYTMGDDAQIFIEEDINVTL